MEVVSRDRRCLLGDIGTLRWRGPQMRRSLTGRSRCSSALVTPPTTQPITRAITGFLALLPLNLDSQLAGYHRHRLSQSEPQRAEFASMAVASAPVASAAPRLPTSHRDASVADARPQTCAAAHGAKCRSISKVGEFAFSRKVAALEVA